MNLNRPFIAKLLSGLCYFLYFLVFVERGRADRGPVFFRQQSHKKQDKETKTSLFSFYYKDAGFYHLYSTLVIPALRKVNLCPQDRKLINEYLSIGDTPLL